MSTKVYTESVCDVCGVVARQEGAHGYRPAPRWATCVLSYRDEPTAVNHGWGDRFEVQMCPDCADRVEAVIDRGRAHGAGAPPQEEA